MKTARLPNGVEINFPDHYTKGEMDTFVRRASGVQENHSNQGVQVQLPAVNIPDIVIPEIKIPPFPSFTLPAIHVAEGAPEILGEIAGNLLGLQEVITELTKEVCTARKEMVRVHQEDKQNNTKLAADIRSQMAQSSKQVSDSAHLITQALLRKKRVITDSTGNPIALE